MLTGFKLGDNEERGKNPVLDRSTKNQQKGKGHTGTLLEQWQQEIKKKKEKKRKNAKNKLSKVY